MLLSKIKASESDLEVDDFGYGTRTGGLGVLLVSQQRLVVCPRQTPAIPQQAQNDTPVSHVIGKKQKILLQAMWPGPGGMKQQNPPVQNGNASTSSTLWVGKAFTADLCRVLSLAHGLCCNGML